jgi:ornithine cyclodeaminase
MPPDHPDVLFVPYRDTLELLSIDEAMRICEDVYRMHAAGSVGFSAPPSQKLDTSAPFHNHWHVKAAILKDLPVTGVRLYNYFDDGAYNNVGRLDCCRYVMLADPATGHALAIVDEHWSYGARSAAAAVVPCKWLAIEEPRVLGLIGVGTMGTNALRCLLTLYRFEEIRAASRRPESRERFAREWSERLGIPVKAVANPEEAARGADIIVGGTTSSEILCHEAWLKPGCTFISLARRELDPGDWAKMDKVVIDDWDFNYAGRSFRDMVDRGQFSRSQLHAHIHEVVTGAKRGRESDRERILIHTAGLVSQDVAVCNFIFEKAKAEGRGSLLPAAR